MEEKYSLVLLVSVFAIAGLSTLLAELLNYYLVYNKDEYQALVSTLKSLNKKLEKVNENLTGITKAQEKKKSMLEENIKMKSTELTMKKFKSTFVKRIHVGPSCHSMELSKS